MKKYVKLVITKNLLFNCFYEINPSKTSPSAR